MHLKKKNLELDLDAFNQQELSKFIAEQSFKREARMAGRKATKNVIKKQITAF